MKKSSLAIFHEDYFILKKDQGLLRRGKEPEVN